MQKTPSILSSNTTTSSLIQDKYTGIIFKIGCKDSLLNAINYAFNNKDFVKNIGENAYKEFIQNFNEKQNYDNIMKIYKEVI